MKTFDSLLKLGAILFILAFARMGGSATIQVTNTAASGPGSFQQAILTANASPGTNIIVFQISNTPPPFIIRPTSALPAVNNPVVIDATTQPGYAGTPIVELSGANTSSGTIGLRFIFGYSTLRGLAISQFPVQAVELDGPSNVIQGNFIGTDVTGMTQSDNGVSGVYVLSVGNLIGGTNAGNGNLISGGAIANNRAGIYVLGGGNNIIQGNLIGVNAAGTGAFNSANNGIVLKDSGGNLIGGPVAAARNIISGNGLSGIYLTGTKTAGNVIQGNYLGTDFSGSLAVSNLNDGITLSSATGNLICSNLISGNGKAGVSLLTASSNQLFGNFIGTDVTGKIALANHNNGNYNYGVLISGGGWNQVGGTNAGAGNLISGNSQHGIALTSGTSTNLIQGNLIGLTAAGNSALGNVEDGIVINGGIGNLIGGTVAAARNVISGNGFNGVDIVQLTDSGNTVLGNYIGTDVTGTQSIGNKQTGVLIAGCSNLIGGTIAGAGNVISGNSQQGIGLVGNNGNVQGNVIQGNLIGLAAAGTAGLGNGSGGSFPGSAGIGISTASANLVGGVVPGAANVISANNGYGVSLVGYTAVSNLVQGNFIGTDPTGTVGLGNFWAGIYLYEAATNQIGGSVPGAGNVISGNDQQGIFLEYAAWNVIQGNLIGTAADGASNLGNQYHNIDLQAGANDNIIGGTAAGAGNTLAFASMYYQFTNSIYYHGYCGVRVRFDATNDLISGNSIFSNGKLGIDLSPTTGGNAANFNPIVDCEDGVVPGAANAGQNFPTLSDIYVGKLTRVRGSLDSKPNETYTLQFFASSAGNSSGYGDGQVYLGQTNLTLGGSCSSNFTAYLPVSVPAGWVVTATATDSSNNTSEFSAWVPVIALPPLQQSLSRPSHFALSWTNNGGTFALQQTTNLTPPVVWLPVTNVPALVSNFMVTTLSVTNAGAFYRLIAP